jgi:hypothetical protein
MHPNEVGFWITTTIITLCIVVLFLLIDWRQ